MCMWNKHHIKDNALIDLYMVVDTEDNDDIYTIVNNVKDAIEYITRVVRIENLDHYEAWCDIRNCNPDDFESWKTYYNNCLVGTKKLHYSVRKYQYEFKNIISIMRMFTECLPIGCSYDHPAEFERAKEMNFYRYDEDEQEIENNGTE